MSLTNFIHEAVREVKPEVLHVYLLLYADAMRNPQIKIGFVESFLTSDDIKTLAVGLTDQQVDDALFYLTKHCWIMECVTCGKHCYSLGSCMYKSFAYSFDMLAWENTKHEMVEKLDQWVENRPTPPPRKKSAVDKFLDYFCEVHLELFSCYPFDKKGMYTPYQKKMANEFRNSQPDPKGMIRFWMENASAVATQFAGTKHEEHMTPPLGIQTLKSHYLVTVLESMMNKQKNGTSNRGGPVSVDREVPHSWSGE